MKIIFSQLQFKSFFSFLYSFKYLLEKNNVRINIKNIPALNNLIEGSGIEVIENNEIEEQATEIVEEKKSLAWLWWVLFTIILIIIIIIIY